MPGAKSNTEKAGPYNGKLTRFNQRLQNKLDDKRMGFMFHITEDELSLSWLKTFCQCIMGEREEKNQIE